MKANIMVAEMKIEKKAYVDVVLKKHKTNDSYLYFK